jgi:hypothetical protein
MRSGVGPFSASPRSAETPSESTRPDRKGFQGGIQNAQGLIGTRIAVSPSNGSSDAKSPSRAGRSLQDTLLAGGVDPSLCL